MKYTDLKVGDKVICAPGYVADGNIWNQSCGGSAYIKGQIYTVTSINPNQGNNAVAWFKEISSRGCYIRALELYNPVDDYEIY